jgi:four helix bundle protein
MPERDFRKSLIWKKSRLLMLALFNATETFSAPGSYELTNQIRHDCLAMVANIVKACGNLMPQEVVEFFRTAWRAANDLEAHLLSAGGRGLLNAASCERLAHEVTVVKGMLAVYIK